MTTTSAADDPRVKVARLGGTGRGLNSGAAIDAGSSESGGSVGRARAMRMALLAERIKAFQERRTPTFADT